MNDTPSMGDLFGGEAAGGWLNMPRGDLNAPQGVDIAVPVSYTHLTLPTKA